MTVLLIAFVTLCLMAVVFSLMPVFPVRRSPWWRS